MESRRTLLTGYDEALGHVAATLGSAYSEGLNRPLGVAVSGD